MTTCFYQMNTVFQTVLLVISQLTVIFLASELILLFSRKSNLRKQISVSLLLALNVTLYILMQLNSRITGGDKGFHLHIPYVLLTVVTLLSITLGVWLFLSETKNRKTINNASIKEAFDNLPTGVCFFNESGLPVLCNHAMYRFSFAVCGKDVQFITDLENCLEDSFVPVTDTKKDGKVFVLSNGCAWQLEKRIFAHENGDVYTQFVATDVTKLHNTRVELQNDNARLSRVQADLQRLSANIVAVTREEEILNTKMRVHDEMGRCLVEARKYMRQGCDENIPDSVVKSWQRAVSMIKYNNETTDEDMLYQVRKTCESVKLNFIQNGTLPKEEDTAYILTCAIRECVTNAVRYAGAKELYVDFSETDDTATVVVTNNGKQPDSEIVEGGGLSTLRRRVEYAGGTMTVQSFPAFSLTVNVPKNKGGIL